MVQGELGQEIPPLEALEEVTMFDQANQIPVNMLKVQKETAGKKKGSNKKKSPGRGGSKPK